MAPSVDARTAAMHPQRLRVESDSDPQELGKRQIGLAIETALRVAGLTNKEAAFAMRYADSAVIGRWVAGSETPQFAKLWTLGHKFRCALVVALAEGAGDGIKVVKEIRLEMSA